MATPLYMDVHVPKAVTNQLRRRGVDVLTAQEDHAQRLDDGQLLERSTELRRLLVTQDILRQSNSSFAVVSARLPCASGWLETLADAVAGPQSPASSVVATQIETSIRPPYHSAMA